MPTELIRADCVIPAPMMSETTRQKRVEEHRLDAWARGFIIEKEWRVHTPVFDKKGEKTTTMMRIRPAKSEDELEFILSKIEEANVDSVEEIKDVVAVYQSIKQMTGW